MANRLTIQDLKQFAQSLGGDCLSTEYKGVNAKYKWKTPFGRVLKARGRLNQAKTML